jgi:cyclopropane fatty-acyl-phospholipid synthase-like methyltransferase
MASAAGAPPVTVMSQRREKRRLVSSSAMNLRDPLHLLHMAVRMDESSCEIFLKEPLRFHRPLEKDFGDAMAFLESQSRFRYWKKSQTVALTPIILSGLISAQQAQEQDLQNADASQKDQNLPTASELVLYCNAMRRQALQRVRQRTKRRKLRNSAIAVGFGIMTVAVTLGKLSVMERTIMELGYSVSAENDLFSSGLQPCAWMERDEGVCRVAEANLWAYFRDYASLHSAELRDCTRRRCSRDVRNMIRRQLSSIPDRAADFDYGHGPYAMHTIATREDVMWKSSRSKADPWWKPHENGIKNGLQWLGDTTVNQLVRQHLLKSKKKDALRLLDVGCGIGGTLYALAGAAQDRWVQVDEFDRLDYTGIAISSAEITNARRLVAEHGMDLDSIRFEQMSYDSESIRELGKFSTVIAIESLSFSRNMADTLSNLASVMQSGGVLILVDDVIHSPRGDRRNMTQVESRIAAYSATSSRPSLLTHSEWKKALKDSGFTITEAMDLGLSFTLPQLDHSSHTANWQSWLFRALGWNEQRNVLLRPLQLWESWIRARMGKDHVMTRESDIRKLAQLQTIQLMQESIRFLSSKALRREGHELLDLTYNMYVCTKR